MPGVHRVAALLQSWLRGTHHGDVQPEQLDDYLDQFVFRFRRLTSVCKGLLKQAVDKVPVTYNMVANSA